MMPDPRRSSRYVVTRRKWMRQQVDGTPCALCGRPVDVSLPGTAPWGPTVEHLTPVRALRRMARDEAELIAMCCDVTTWALSHRRCQDRQGAQVSNRTRHGRPAPGDRPPAPPTRPERAW
jgi:hypothetical protein